MSRKPVITIGSSPGDDASDAPALSGTAKIRVNGAALESSVDGGFWAPVSGVGTNYGYINVKDYGATGDGVTDDIAAFDAAMVSQTGIYPSAGGRKIIIPPGNYVLSRSWHISRPCVIEGSGGPQYLASSILNFPANVDGLVIDRYNTSIDGGAGDGAIIRGLSIRSIMSGTGSAVRMYARASIEDCQITGWGLNGIRLLASFGGTGGDVYPTWQASHAYALATYITSLDGGWWVCKRAGISAASGGPTGTPAYNTLITDNTAGWGYISGSNANGWWLNRITISYIGGDGIRLNGGDTNAGIGTAIDFVSCGGIAINENSFLGNTWIGCQTAACGGSYVATNANCRSLFLGCYNESDTPGPVIGTPSQLIGGLILGASGTGMIFQNNGFNNPIAFSPGNQLTRTIGGTAGQEYLEQYQFGNDGTRFYLKYKTAASVAASGITDSFVYDYANTSIGWGWSRTTLAMQSLIGALPRRMGAAQLFTYTQKGIINEGQRIAHDDSPTGRSGSWLVGDIVFRRNPTPTTGIGWAVTTSGTNGTYVEGLTATANGTATVVLSAATNYITGLGAGDTLLINGVTSRIVDINVALDTLTMSANIPTGAGLAIAYVAPTFTEFGALFTAPGNSVSTPGASTLNTRKGLSAIATGAASVVITNSLVTATSVVLAQLASADATLTQVLRCVPAAGSFTITGNANATAATTVAWKVES